jgi:hypothetical protein
MQTLRQTLLIWELKRVLSPEKADSQSQSDPTSVLWSFTKKNSLASGGEPYHRDSKVSFLSDARKKTTRSVPESIEIEPTVSRAV